MADTHSGDHKSTHEEDLLAPVQKRWMALAFVVCRGESFAPSGARNLYQTVSLSHGFRHGPQSVGPAGPGFLVNAFTED